MFPVKLFGQKQSFRPKRPQAEQYRKAARSQFLTCFKSIYRFLSGPKKEHFFKGSVAICLEHVIIHVICPDCLRQILEFESVRIAAVVSNLSKLREA